MHGNKAGQFEIWQRAYEKKVLPLKAAADKSDKDGAYDKHDAAYFRHLIKLHMAVAEKIRLMDAMVKFQHDHGDLPDSVPDLMRRLRDMAEVWYEVCSRPEGDLMYSSEKERLADKRTIAAASLTLAEMAGAG